MIPQPSAPVSAEAPPDFFGRLQRLLRHLHLWLGLILTLPLVVVALTGSILVFQHQLEAFFDPEPHLTGTRGDAHSIAEILSVARAKVGKDFTPFVYEAPRTPEQPAMVRFVALGRATGPRVIAVLVDPVSLELVPWHRHLAVPDLLRWIVRLHGNLLMGREGRIYVGWLGVAMLALGISGLILWWPRGHRWRSAFLVKRGAHGLRLYRDLHGAAGIWAYAVFITVSFTGVYLVFPQPVSGAVTKLLPSREINSAAPVVRGEGAARIDADRAVAVALAAAPGARLISLGLPVRPNQPYRVSLAHHGDDRGAPVIGAVVDPWSAALIGLDDPTRYAPAQAALAWMFPLHSGEGLGWVWRTLVFLSGLLPALFAYTGIAMWLIKRRARRRAGAALSPARRMAPR